MSFKFEFSEKWIIVKVDGYMRRYINKRGKTALSNDDPKIFFSKKEAEN